MKNLKRILSLLLVAIMLISTVPAISAASVTFTDVSDHWAWKQGQIPYLADKGVINGIKQSNGTYKFEPESPVTRAQFVKMLVETFGLTATTSINYNDVKSSDWFYTHFQKAAAQGFLLNYGKTVNPNANIPREEAVALIMRYLALENVEAASESSFTDTSKISSYYRQDVLQAVGAGIINGIQQKDGTYKFEPQNTLKRSEALTIIYKAVGCIFNKTTTGRDNGAYSTNNIINKGGITLTNVTFTGRNLITEGASSGKVTLSNCKVNGTLYVRGAAELVLSNTSADEIIIIGGGKVTLQSNSVVNVLTISKTTSIALTSGTIGTLNINPKATDVSVTGTGKIQSAVITASGFKSSMVPDKYDIASGLIAAFGTTYHEGNSDSAKAYLSTPFASSENGYYTVNVKTGYSGKIRLYYTNNSAKPSSTDFDTYFKNSQFTTSFEIKANEMTSHKTFTSGEVSKFKYVVIQLVSNSNKYAPVVVSNSVLSGNGFKTEPELTGTTTVTYVPESAGNLYWFYSDSGELLNQADFLDAYNAKESALKGKVTTSANKSATLTLNSRYMANYPFIVFMASNSSGVNYNPVLLSIGDNGFKKDPLLVSAGSIQFTSSFDGKLYYYLSDNGTIPDVDEYYDIWRKASTSLRSSMTVTKDEEETFVFNTRYTTQYPYMIIALEDKNGEFFTAVALYINYTTGFKSNAVVDSANDTVKLETTAAGTVKYYYTNSNSLPNAAEFLEIYDDTAKGYKGSIEASGSKVVTIECNGAYITKYPYLVIMFTDVNEGVYYPILVDLSQSYTEKSGFATSPKYSSTTGKITFSVYTDSMVMYYFTDETNPSTEESDFYSDWLREGGKQMAATANKSTTITADSTAKYAVIAVMIDSDYAETSATIVAVKLEDTPTSTTPINGTGFTYEIMNANLFIMPKVDGSISYYLTNSTSGFPDGDFSAAYNANGGKTVVVTKNVVTHISCSKTYVVLCMRNGDGQSYDYLILNTKTNQPVQENLPTDYGFEYELEDYLEALTGYSFTFKATVTGKFTTYVVVGSNKTKVDKLTFNVTAGSTYTVDFADQVAILENYQTSGSITFQITAGGTGYKEFTISPQK